MPMVRSAARPPEPDTQRDTQRAPGRDSESAAACGWLSLAGIVLFTVLMAVHVVGRTGVWSDGAAPARWAQPADRSGHAPS
jgi:hypothetical protein